MPEQDKPDTLMGVITSRRSVRSFRPDPLPEETIDALIEAARWAPSAGNLQPWEFYVIRDPLCKLALAEAALGQGFIAEAPVVIVICAIPSQSARKYGERGARLYCLQDTALAGQNLMLLAAAMGLGTCWVGAFDEEAVSMAISAPPGRLPVAIIPVGHPRRIPEAPPRRSRAEITRHE